jgi:hypothetical protein
MAFLPVSLSAKLNGKSANAQALKRQIARRWVHLCAFVRRWNARTPQTGPLRPELAHNLSAFGTASGVSTTVVMQKIHILTDY